MKVVELIINVDDLKTGVDAVALVERPAIQEDFMAFATQKVSLDYDGTLSTQKGKDLAKSLIDKGYQVYVISARGAKEGMLETTRALGIPDSRVFATGSNTAKIAKIKELGIVKHYDNNEHVTGVLDNVGQKFASVDTIIDHLIAQEFGVELTEEKFAETYNDYPEAAVNAAKQGIKRNEELGNPCATSVGKQRAQQLANGENLSIDTIKRMRSFLIRQKDNYDLAVSRKDYEACGYISYLLWGGPSALPWAEKKLKQAGYEFDLLETCDECDRENAKIPFAMTDESSVSKSHKFAQELQDKQMLVGPLMTPNKLMDRIDETTGEPYQAYFTADTIKNIAYKMMKNKFMDNINIEHDENSMVDDVYLVETWLVEDPQTDKSTLYGFSPIEGQWFGMYKVDNTETWTDYVKTGLVKGFSVEGYFQQKFNRL